MASFCRSAITASSRSLASRSKTVTQKTLNAKSMSSPFTSTPTPTRTILVTSRVVSVLGSVESLMPLHSAISNARLKSNIAVDSSCWSWLSQAFLSQEALHDRKHGVLFQSIDRQPQIASQFCDEFFYNLVIPIGDTSVPRGLKFDTIGLWRPLRERQRLGLEDTSVQANQGRRFILRRRVDFFMVMENSYETSNGNGPTENGHKVIRHNPYQLRSLPWLDLRLFYVRVSKCEIGDFTPEHLSVNHIPLYPDTLLEVNGVRTSINSDGASTTLRRDRLDKKSEEATFVSTDGIRMTGSVKFEVFDKDVLILSGALEACCCNGFVGESRNHDQRWTMNCESDMTIGTSFLKAKQFVGPDSEMPTIEVYVAGSFSGTPIILTKTLQLGFRKKQIRKGILDSIPEYEATESQDNAPSRIPLELSEYSNHKPENEDYCPLYPATEFMDGEDGEMSWFNAGVRVGVGIGLSICVGIGIGVGLLVRTYQGTTRNFRRRLL
ncbi:unnamed protein product [Dovyalis caffra]|uniref:Uncharacterized protein n=1 Tax=Dovyalis caffra TaxID=77055 RepID=A0AAV1RBH6_9ROSI|nr:unnamed protein product [Dovyalis caffra]